MSLFTLFLKRSFRNWFDLNSTRNLRPRSVSSPLQMERIHLRVPLQDQLGFLGTGSVFVHSPAWTQLSGGLTQLRLSGVMLQELNRQVRSGIFHWTRRKVIFSAGNWTSSRCRGRRRRIFLLVFVVVSSECCVQPRTWSCSDIRRASHCSCCRRCLNIRAAAACMNEKSRRRKKRFFFNTFARERFKDG